MTDPNGTDPGGHVAAVSQAGPPRTPMAAHDSFAASRYLPHLLPAARVFTERAISRFPPAQSRVTSRGIAVGSCPGWQISGPPIPPPHSHLLTRQRARMRALLQASKPTLGGTLEQLPGFSQLEPRKRHRENPRS